MKRRSTLKVGDCVRVRGMKGTASIQSLLTDIPGGVFLDRPIGDFRHWNVDGLVKVRRGGSSGNESTQTRRVSTDQRLICGATGGFD